MRSSAWWRIGWRNLGRNRRRTLITAIGLALGYLAVVVMSGLSRGLVSEMIDNGTGMVTGQLQVFAEDYLPDRGIFATIGGREGVNVETLVATVNGDSRISAATPRVYAGGLVSTGDATAAGVILGVDPELEPRVSRLLSHIDEGRPPTPGQYEIVIGREMARQLDAAPGDEVVVVAPGADGSLGNDLFIVSGIFTTTVTELDLGHAVAPIEVVQELVALPPGRIHEIAARVDDPWAADAAAVGVEAAIGTEGPAAVVRPWTEFRPEMVEYANLVSSMEWMLIVFVFGMAIWGVANTMLMSSFERRREFAVLLALGGGPGFIVRSVLAEAVVLGAVALAAGLAVTLPILAWWKAAPPDMSWVYGGFTMAGGLMRPILRVEWPTSMIFITAGAMFVTALFAALYPAHRSSRVPPADTLAGR
ncbi:MAG: ABC transporter permease [Planctomycetota bacterium]|jgi:ABC-type lipoprotein release transport system permease subunit